MISTRAYRAICDATVSESSDWIVEIGAGLGTLTMRLAERVPDGMVIAIERDRDMVAVLETELGQYDNVQIEPTNAMTYDLGAAARWAGQPLTICGNLPYNIASQILFRAIEFRADVRRAVIMLQKEMAERILASPGTKSYGAMTVLIASFARRRRVLGVRASSFSPVPKVDSMVLRLDFEPDGAPLVDIADEAGFFETVHAAFAMRRKTLRNNLRAHFGEPRTDAALAATGIDGGRRAETLEPHEHAALSRALVDAGAA